MKKIYLINTTLILFLLIFPANKLFSQESLNIFGSTQSIWFSEDLKTSVIKPFDSTLGSNNRTSFAIQQMDLFFSKSFLDKFKVFVDLEFRLNYSSTNDWGDLNLQEAWIGYDFNDKLNIKAGLLYPKFNNLNEIKNKLALLPTIFRPVVYEVLLSNVINIEDFLPEKAFLQVSGSLPVNYLLFDYAVYMGNAENSYLTTNRDKYYFKERSFISGTDKTDWKLKLYGARIGIRKNDETFKLGASLSHDYDNKRDTSWFYMKMFKPPFGDLPRWKLGFDLSFKFWKFFVESEYINVFYDDNNPDDDFQFDKQFFYAMLLLNATNDLYVYARYQFFSDKFELMDGTCITGGIGYKLNDFITFKSEFMNHSQYHKFLKWEREVNVDVNYFVLGISAFF